MKHARIHIRLFLASTLLAVGIAAPASADAIADKKAEAARVVKRIEELRDGAERLTEQYKREQIELRKLEAELVVTQAQVDATATETAALANEATQVAVRAYIYGGSSSGPTRLIDDLGGADNVPREAYLSTLLGDLNDVSDQVRMVQQDVSGRQARLRQQQARKVELTKLVEKRRQEAATAIEKSQALLVNVKGDLAELVRQEEIRRQKEIEAAAKKAAEERIAARARRGSSRGGCRRCGKPCRSTRGRRHANRRFAHREEADRTGPAELPGSICEGRDRRGGGTQPAWSAIRVGHRTSGREF